MLDDMFGDLRNSKESERFSAFWSGYMAGAIPEAKHCDTNHELSLWFTRFERACGVARRVAK